MRNRNFPLLLAISTLFFIVALAGCSSQKALSEPVASESLSLEEIINRSRLAMADVVTYKTRGATYDSEPHRERRLVSNSFSEMHSYDRYKFGNRSSGVDGTLFTEWMQVGTQMFYSKDGPAWQEREPRSEPRAPTPPSIGAFSFLYGNEFGGESELSLISRDEVTEDGISVYRLGYTVNFDHFWGERPVSELYTFSLLIDKESFRVVARIFEKDYSSEPYGPRGLTSWQMDTKIDYYDINQPVVIEVPDEYVPWEELVVLN